jgi:FkbM family methyltransferase
MVTSSRSNCTEDVKMTAHIPAFAKQTIRSLQRYASDLRENYKEATFRPYTTKKRIDGVDFDFYVGDPTGQLWYDSGGAYSEGELRFLRKHVVSHGDIIFDVGGHHGWNALIMSRLVASEGKVFTFEPNPKNAEIIRRNVSLNGCANVTVVTAAIGPRDQDVMVTNMSDTIIKPDKINDRYWPEDCRRKSVSQGIAVKMHSLDSYARQHNIFPTLLKVDVEGYEIEVLRGSRSILARKPKLCLEIHHPNALARYQTFVDDVFGLITMSQYRLWLQVGDNDDIHPIEDTSELPKLGGRFHLYAVPLSS